MENQETLAEGTVIDGRYELQQVLGMGGVGVVYQALDLKLRRTVALKLLKPEFAEHETLRPRFEREAETMASLMHPNLALVLDYGLRDGIPYIVMELLQGGTLLAEMDARPMTEERARNVIFQLLHGLAYAHQRGIAHRDIKPANILLQTHPTMGQQVKILDFGFAKILSNTPDTPSDGAALTIAGTAFGTPTYMAPEQVTVGNMDARTDVYSVGVLLFEMLAGVPPFQGGLSELLRKHLAAEVPPISACCPGAQASEELEALLKRAMAKKPDERFADAAALATALEQLPRPWMICERAGLALAVTGRAPASLADNDALNDSQSNAEMSSHDSVSEGEAPTRAFIPSRTTASPQQPTQTIQGSNNWKAIGVALLSQLGQSVRDVEQRFALRSRALALIKWLGRQAVRVLPMLVLVASRTRTAMAPRLFRAAQFVKDRPPVGYTLLGTLLALLIVATRSWMTSTEPASESKASSSATDSRSHAKQTGATKQSTLWSTAKTPKALQTLRDQVREGRDLDTEQIKSLRDMAASDRSDPRPHLVLAANYMQRGWRPDALKTYQLAYKTSHQAIEDPRMLIDLVALREHRKVGRMAERLFEDAYGHDVNEAIDKALTRKDLNDDDKAHLQELQQSLAQAK